MVGADAQHRARVAGRGPRAAAAPRARSGRAGRGRRSCCEFVGIAARAGEAAREPALRRPAAARDRPRAGHRAPAAAARRAGRGDEPGREGSRSWSSSAGSATPGYRAADRARHGSGDGHQRPDRGAGLRREDRRGPARARCGSNPKVIEAYLGRRPMLLEVEDLAVHYGKIAALQGRHAGGRRGRDRHADRRQRRRQDHHAEDPLRAAAGQPAGGSCSRAQDISRMPGAQAGPAGICQAPEGRGMFPGMTVPENLAMGCLHRGGSRDPGDSNGSSRCSRGWPNARRRAAAPCPAASSRCWRSAGR